LPESASRDDLTKEQFLVSASGTLDPPHQLLPTGNSVPYRECFVASPLWPSPAKFDLGPMPFLSLTKTLRLYIFNVTHNVAALNGLP
jgi:hypothetical protein